MADWVDSQSCFIPPAELLFETSRLRSRSVLTQLFIAERYTCYDLGESILVGGGDQESGAADGGQADMQRVTPLLLVKLHGM